MRRIHFIIHTSPNKHFHAIITTTTTTTNITTDHHAIRHRHLALPAFDLFERKYPCTYTLLALKIGLNGLGRVTVSLEETECPEVFA